MTTKQGIDIHRTALALIQANKARDTEACVALLTMVQGPDADLLLCALANMVHVAFGCNPVEGWDAFMERYADAIEQEEAKLRRKTDT
jgi:hypothetical protein